MNNWSDFQIELDRYFDSHNMSSEEIERYASMCSDDMAAKCDMKSIAEKAFIGIVTSKGYEVASIKDMAHKVGYNHMLNGVYDPANFQEATEKLAERCPEDIPTTLCKAYNVIVKDIQEPVKNVRTSEGDSINAYAGLFGYNTEKRIKQFIRYITTDRDRCDRVLRGDDPYYRDFYDNEIDTFVDLSKCYFTKLTKKRKRILEFYLRHNKGDFMSDVRSLCSDDLEIITEVDAIHGAYLNLWQDDKFKNFVNAYEISHFDATTMKLYDTYMKAPAAMIKEDDEELLRNSVLGRSNYRVDIHPEHNRPTERNVVYHLMRLFWDRCEFDLFTPDTLRCEIYDACMYDYRLVLSCFETLQKNSNDEYRMEVKTLDERLYVTATIYTDDDLTVKLYIKFTGTPAPKTLMLYESLNFGLMRVRCYLDTPINTLCVDKLLYYYIENENYQSMQHVLDCVKELADACDVNAVLSKYPKAVLTSDPMKAFYHLLLNNELKVDTPLYDVLALTGGKVISNSEFWNMLTTHTFNVEPLDVIERLKKRNKVCDYSKVVDYLQ